jgi:hypothetical protein
MKKCDPAVPEAGEGRVFYVSDLVAAQVQPLHVSAKVQFY